MTGQQALTRFPRITIRGTLAATLEKWQKDALPIDATIAHGEPFLEMRGYVAELVEVDGREGINVTVRWEPVADGPP